MSLFCSLSHLWCDRLFTEQERVVITELSRRCTSVWYHSWENLRRSTAAAAALVACCTLMWATKQFRISSFVPQHTIPVRRVRNIDVVALDRAIKSCWQKMLKKNFYQNTLIAECHTNSQNSILQPDMFNEIWHILVVALNWCFTLTWSAIKLSTYIQVQRRQFLLPSRPLQEMYFYM